MPDRLAGIGTTPKRAVVVLVITVMVTSFVNWGCGLVVAGLLAREIAKRIRIDFGWLVAAAYSGWIIWASGLSSSIALAQATPGSALNVVQKVTGKLLRRLEKAWVLNLIVVIAGVAALGITWAKSGFNLDINSVIFLFFIAGLLLHWRPIAYVEAINNAARVTGPLILQYPLYGGIMGICLRRYECPRTHFPLKRAQ